MEEFQAGGEFEAAIPVEPIAYRISEDSLWRGIWKILGWGGLFVGATRVAGAFLNLWSYGLFFTSPVNGQASLYAGSKYMILAGAAWSSASGVMLIVGSLMLVSGYRWPLAVMRIVEICYLLCTMIGAMWNLFVTLQSKSVYASVGPNYLLYLITTQCLGSAHVVVFSLIAIPLLTVGMREERFSH